MAESRHLLIFWEMLCFISGKKFLVSKDCGFTRGKGLSGGFNIRYQCLLDFMPNGLKFEL